MIRMIDISPLNTQPFKGEKKKTLSYTNVQPTMEAYKCFWICYEIKLRKMFLLVNTITPKKIDMLKRFQCKCPKIDMLKRCQKLNCYTIVPRPLDVYFSQFNCYTIVPRPLDVYIWTEIWKSEFSIGVQQGYLCADGFGILGHDYQI